MEQTEKKSEVIFDIKSEKFREPQARFMQFTMDKAGEVILWVGSNANIIYVNDAACEHFAYDRSSLLKMSLFDISPTINQKNWDSRWNKAKQEGSYHFESVHQAKSKEIIPVEVTVDYMHFEGHEYQVIFAKNIIAKKIRQRELSRLATFAELNPSPVIEIDRMGFVHYMNRIARKLFPTMPHEKFKHPFLRSIKELVIRKQISKKHFPICHANVGDICYEQMCHFAMDGARIRILARDITEKEQAVRELEKQREFFRKVIDLNPNFIFAKDLNGRFTLVNKAVADAYGTTVCDLLGKTDADYNGEEDEVEHFRKDDLEVLDSKKRKFIPEENITDSQGKVRWLQTVKIPLLSDEGQATQILGVATDITDRKLAEQERIKLESQMQHTQKLESLGVLAGGIAHDFNNLLMGIVGNCSLALLELDKESPVFDKIENIKKASGRLSELTNQLLAYSGRGKFMTEPTNLSDLSAEMLSLLSTIISKKVTLKHTFKRKLPNIMADVTQLRQVVMNLITNASDAMESLSGSIEIKTGVCMVDSEFLRGAYLNESLPYGKYVFLEVKDSGCGMDHATQKKIFDPFFTTKFIGRGLGLSAVLGIVRSHGGSIKVKSSPGIGTTVSVAFPIISGEIIREEETEAFDIDMRQYKNSGLILIVDDEKVTRDTAKSMLEHFGYDVVTAADGLEGVSQFKNLSSSLSAVLLDLTMPGIDGEETLREMRKVSGSVPVILTSGYTELDATKNFREKNFSSFIQKPYGPKNLLAKLEMVIDDSD